MSEEIALSNWDTLAVNEKGEKKMSREIESKEMIRDCMMEALGIYTAKETKHKDEWRDKDVWSNFMHLKHEIEEINRSKDLQRQIHNALDACGQAAILAARLKMELKENKDKSYLLHTPQVSKR